MDDPNITMEEYIRLEEENARKCGKVFNWETAKYGQIWYDEDVHDIRSVETEFPAIVFNDSLTSNETPSCEPTVSSLNDEIDFRISFDEFDDEDYMVVFDKNLFSYKIISTNDLETDSKNDNDKINMPSPKPEVSYFNDLDFFKDFENEFPAIVYNDALTSKSYFLTEPTSMTPLEQPAEPNYEVTCEEEVKRRNSRAKTKIFEESTKLHTYVVSKKEDTAEWAHAIQEAAFWALAQQLRDLFVTMLLFYDVSRPLHLWEQTWELLSEDILRRKQKLFKHPNLQLTDAQIKNYCLMEIDVTPPNLGCSGMLNIRGRYIYRSIAQDKRTTTKSVF
ncbi:hypothetical protein Tco_0744829 [Tanacetum coccineum]